MIKKIVRTQLFYSVVEKIVPFLTLAIILLPVWMSPLHPAIASYFILGYLIYFLYKSIKTVYFAAVSYNLLTKAGKVNWYKKLLKEKDFQDYYHYLIITNYKESASKMDETLKFIKDQNYPKSRISIILAMEEREGEEAKKRSEYLTKKYASYFREFYTTYHKLIPGEIIGKASNETFAAKYIDRLIMTNKINPKKVLITVCDADSLLPEDYLSYLTFEYIHDKKRYFHFYWAPVLLYNNFWKLSLPVRVQSILSSVVRISILPQRENLIHVSTYSTNMWLLKEVGFWDPDIIPEDWHIWFQAFFKFGEEVRTLPIYLPISADAVYTNGFWNTFRNRYEQEKRRAWGVSDIPYAIVRCFDTPHIKPIVKIRKLWFLVEHHLFWPSSFFILTLSAYIPPLINPMFKRTVMGFLLPKLSSFILTVSSLLLIFILYFDHKMREKVKIKTELKRMPLLFIQWYLLPIISFVFSSLPALDAHVRLLLGKKIEYKVTDKR